MSTMNTENRVFTRRKRRKPNTITIVDSTPKKYSGSIQPTNLLQEKERFLKHGILPQFVMRASLSHIASLANKPSGQVSRLYLPEAIKILQSVKEKYNSGDQYFEAAFGEKIDLDKASSCLTNYLNEHGLYGHINIVFSNDLDCSARMMWRGPHVKLNKPEARNHTLIIKNSSDNFYLREKGILCLANHEIGTHFLRTLNDGLQPWYADRKAFGLRSLCDYELQRTEEGLAALNTIIQANIQYLYGPALLYYIACMAETMSFRELFYHLEQFVQDADRRWHYVMRVKRHLPDPNDHGGLGRDQCYFEGAIEILRNLDNIQIPLLYSGSLCLDETHRVKRLARLNCIKLPNLLQNAEKYKQQLRWIGYVNGVLDKPQLKKNKASKQLRDLSVNNFVRPGLRESNSQHKPTKMINSSSLQHVSCSASNMKEETILRPKSVENEEQSPAKCCDTSGTQSNRKFSTPPSDHESGPRDVLEKVESSMNSHSNLVKQIESKLVHTNISLERTKTAIAHRHDDNYVVSADLSQPRRLKSVSCLCPTQ